MGVFKLIGIGIVVCVIVVIVKQIKPEFSIFIIIVSSIIMMVYIFNYFGDIIALFDNIVDKTGINADLFKIILKIIGVGYLIEFASNLCAESGSPTIADKIVLCGKLIILTLCMPIINNLLNVVVELL